MATYRTIQLRVREQCGGAGAPGRGLSIEVIKIGEGAAGEEGVANVTYGPLDAAFFVAADRYYNTLQPRNPQPVG